MQFIDFRDTCVITRDNGGRDEWDNPINPEEVYNGPCCYQEGGASFTRIFTTRRPTVFLPGVTVLVNINDSITITTEFGRVVKSVVEVVRDVNMPWRTNVQVTRIELKQAQGD